MKIFPAIDILDGVCVRLFQGDFEQKVSYKKDPLEIALAYQDQGAINLHLVDLDGARAGALKNLAILERLSAKTNLLIDYGGGVKSKTDIQSLLDAGANQVSVGTSAVSNPDLFLDWLNTFSDSIILSADVKNGQVVIAGWQESTAFTVADLIQKYQTVGLSHVACTDVSKDGTMAGPATLLYKELVEKFPDINLIASGGVSTLEDIIALKQAGVFGVIIGKALLDGKFSMSESVRVAG